MNTNVRLATTLAKYREAVTEADEASQKPVFARIVSLFWTLD